MSPKIPLKKKTRGGSFSLVKKRDTLLTHKINLFLPLDKNKNNQLSTAPTTCRDGWLGFLFRWRTQQRAISGINCRIILLPNLWTQMAHGRSPSWAIPVHAILSVEQNKKKKKLKKEKKFFSLFLFFFSKQESELRRGAKGVLPLLRAWPFGLVFAVCDRVLLSNTSFCFPSREAGAAKQNFF